MIQVAGRFPLFLLVAPSGSGKTTLLLRALDARPELFRPITATTRSPRVGEQDGVHYHFLTESEFIKRRDAGEFAEWSEHFGAFYGCLRSELERLLHTPGIAVVDINGAESLMQSYAHTVPIFIQPRDKDELLERLREREEDAGMPERIARIDLEWERGMSYQHRVLNLDIEVALRDLLAIIDRETSAAATAS